jgi:hypothetical protein
VLAAHRRRSGAKDGGCVAWLFSTKAPADDHGVKIHVEDGGDHRTGDDAGVRDAHDYIRLVRASDLQR